MNGGPAAISRLGVYWNPRLEGDSWFSLLAEEELVAQKRESRNSDDGRRKGVCFFRDKVLCALVFADREARHAGAARR